MEKITLSIKDVQDLLGMEYQMASKVIRDIKRKRDRLGVQGKVFTEDFCEYFKLSPTEIEKIKGGDKR